MRARLAAYATAVATRLGPTAARVRAGGAQAWAATKSWSGKGWRAAGHAARWSRIKARRGLLAGLSVTENTLLSPKGREWVHASSVFALIFAFGVTSVDMLVTGGPELVSSASASSAPASRIDLIAATSLPVDGATQTAADETPAPVQEAALPVVLASATPDPAAFTPVGDLVDAPPAKAGEQSSVEAASAAEEKAKGEAQQA